MSDHSKHAASRSLVEQREAAVETVRQQLGHLVRSQSRTQRSIEKENGFQRGYLSQVLNGHISLGLKHVLGILLAIDEPAPRFFESCFAEPYDSQPEIDEIRERMSRYDAAFRDLERRGLVSLPEQDEQKDQNETED